MTCIKTGAVVYFEDYGVRHVCDVHMIGECVIVKGSWAEDGFHNYDNPTRRPATHRLRLGFGILDVGRQFAATDADNFEEL